MNHRVHSTHRIALGIVSTLLGAPLAFAADAKDNVWSTAIGIPRAKISYDIPKPIAAALADSRLETPEGPDAEGKELQLALAKIQEKYEPQIDHEQKEINDKKNDKTGYVNVDGHCNWGETSAKFDIPKTSFKIREFSFDLPKTTFKLRKFSYDYPRCDWKLMNIGFGIKTKFLRCTRDRKEWSTKIPEFKWDTTSFKTKIPEFKWDTTEIKFHTLKCTVDKVHLGADQPKDIDGIEAAGKRIEGIAAAQQDEINDAVAADLDARGEKLAAEIDRVKGEFDVVLAEMDKSVAEIAAGGMDPASVMIEVDGKQVSLVGARAALAAQRDQIVTQMSVEWKKTVDTLTAAVQK